MVPSSTRSELLLQTQTCFGCTPIPVFSTSRLRPFIYSRLTNPPWNLIAPLKKMLSYIIYSTPGVKQIATSITTAATISLASRLRTDVTYLMSHGVWTNFLLVHTRQMWTSPGWYWSTSCGQHSLAPPLLYLFWPEYMASLSKAVNMASFTSTNITLLFFKAKTEKSKTSILLWN